MGGGRACSTVGVGRRTRGSAGLVPGLATEPGRAARGGATGAAGTVSIGSRSAGLPVVSPVSTGCSRAACSSASTRLAFWSTARSASQLTSGATSSVRLGASIGPFRLTEMSG